MKHAETPLTLLKRRPAIPGVDGDEARHRAGGPQAPFHSGGGRQDRRERSVWGPRAGAAEFEEGPEQVLVRLGVGVVGPAHRRAGGAFGAFGASARANCQGEVAAPSQKHAV